MGSRSRATGSLDVGAEMNLETVQFIAGEDDQGQRLDRYVADHMTDLSRSYARQLIEDEHILVNGQRAKPSTIVQAGDTITVRRPLPSPTNLVAEDIPLNVVFENQDVVVIDKPA